MISQSNHPEGQTPDTGMPPDTVTTAQLNDLKAQIDALKGRAWPINLNTDILGLFETVSAAPTTIPKGPYDQIKIYVNSTTYRLYWYDSVGHTWHYVTATA